MTSPDHKSVRSALLVVLALAATLLIMPGVPAEADPPAAASAVATDVPAPPHPADDRAAGDSMRAGDGTHAACDDTPPDGSGDWLPGIDISHWNGTIGWGKVADAGIKFVYAKATQRVDFEDPKYAKYKAAAKEHDIRFGAYDYMDVEGDRAHAIKDADHFVKYADPTQKNLVPVLDVEQTNGYGPNRLTKWIKAWVEEVHRKLKVRAIIYVSPSFWTENLADTTWFAEHGYPLWIAHWFVDQPTLPAKDWNDEGWTFWQWTDCGSVDGIKGNVDLDLFKGSKLKRVIIENAKD